MPVPSSVSQTFQSSKRCIWVEDCSRFTQFTSESDVALPSHECGESYIDRLGIRLLLDLTQLGGKLFQGEKLRIIKTGVQHKHASRRLEKQLKAGAPYSFGIYVLVYNPLSSGIVTAAVPQQRTMITHQKFKRSHAVTHGEQRTDNHLKEHSSPKTSVS